MNRAIARRHGPNRRSTAPVADRTTFAITLGAITGVLLAMAVAAPPLAAQTSPVETASLADGPFASMRMLLEKTFLKVDVLTLDVRFGSDAAGRIRALAEGREYAHPLADSIANVAAHATDAYARLRFERNVGLDQFLDGIRDNLERALAAGYIDRAAFDEISGGLPGWYAFLADRGIHEGDEMFYRIRGDELRVVYVATDGTTLLDRTDPGAHRRLAVLGSYYAPGSDFRESLIRSLFP